MMSYTMLCTSLWVSGGMLIRFMSPSTRIMGGTPEDKCRSDALFLTANASNCAMSTAIGFSWGTSACDGVRGARGSIAEGFGRPYVKVLAEFAGAPRSAARPNGRGGGQRRPKCRLGHTPRRFQGPAGGSDPRGGGGGSHRHRGKLPRRGARQDGSAGRPPRDVAFH